MDLKIMSKMDAENFTDDGYYCISLISLIETKMINPVFKETLSIRVDDITKERQEYMVSIGDEDFGQYILFNEGMKNKILDFIRTHNPKKLVVHCSMGVSRSSSVACLILSNLGVDYDWILKSDKYEPNKYVVEFIENKSKLLLEYMNK